MLQDKNNHILTRVVLCVSVAAFTCFHHVQAESMHVDEMYSANKIISLENVRSNIAYISAYGKCRFGSESKGIARIILVDENGGEHLIGEWDKRFCTDSAFSGMCMETANLQKRPLYIKIVAQNATLQIDSIEWFSNSLLTSGCTISHNFITPEQKANQWNMYNAAHGKHWVAARIDGIDYSFDNIKSLFYCDNDGYYSNGLEYYAGGLFEIEGSTDDKTTDMSDNNPLRDATSYVSYFDWRNRHGKNWITSAKDQSWPKDSVGYGNGGCWAFASVAAVEALANLYFNRLLNLDLSEQDVGACTGGNNTIASVDSLCTATKGGSVYAALTYIQNNGVCDEDCFQFTNNCTTPCSNKCSNPAEHIHIAGKSSIYPRTSNTLKNAIINYGPITSGIYDLVYWNNGSTSHCSHAMCMVGYGTIAAGDTLKIVHDGLFNSCDTTIIIPVGDPLIGHTYWIFKNSYGNRPGHNGFVYMVFPEDSNGYLSNVNSSTYKVLTPITSINYTDSDIAVTDADNDGYYFWGLGPKPSHCPICCPDIPDGDDSDPTKAEMDSYGNFASYIFPYSPTTISSDTIWNTNSTHCGNIIVTNNATLTITAELTMNPAAKIIVQDGGTVIVDAGSVVNATVDVQSSSKIILRNNGTLYLKRWGDLNVHLGAEADITYGRVLLQ